MSNPKLPTEKPVGKKAATFSIANLLALTAMVGILLIPVSIWGSEGIGGTVFLGFFFLVGWGLWNAPIGVFAKIVCGIGLLGILIGMFMPATRYARPSKRALCSNNMRQLALACHNYQSAYGTLPPPFTVDEQGRPLHSWRVLILPFIEEQALYDDLDLARPWNDPLNIQHAHRMPAIFNCPITEATFPGRFSNVKTPYVAVVGKETVWNPNAGGLSFEDFPDGASNTILILETNVRPVHWMSPTDVAFSEIVAVNGQGETDLISSNHEGGSNVALVDGSAQFLPDTVTAEELGAALTIEGGEEVDILDW